jgi:hypothetical protein
LSKLRGKVQGDTTHHGQLLRYEYDSYLYFGGGGGEGGLGFRVLGFRKIIV